MHARAIQISAQTCAINFRSMPERNQESELEQDPKNKLEEKQKNEEL